MVGFLRKKITRRGRNHEVVLGIAPGAATTAMAIIRWSDDIPVLQGLQMLPGTLDAQASELRQFLRARKLEKAPVNLLAPEGDYQVLVAEKPAVPEADLLDAIRWRIKDLVKEPVDSLVIDVMSLFGRNERTGEARVYCAAMPRERSEALGRLCRSASMRLHSIDVPEMAMRNLGLLLGAVEQNFAVLQVGARSSLICIQHGAGLYMARRFECGFDNRGEDSARLVGELQRTMNFFESQMGKGYIAQLVILPPPLGAEILQLELSGAIMQRIKMFDPLQDITHELVAPLPPEHLSQYALAIGAGLRVYA